MAGPSPLSAADPVRLGGWELLGRLGTGGQGAVYLGRPVDPGAGPSRVAVKLLHAQLLADAGARERFVRELALLQRVAGFCTAQMLAADMAGDRPYIVSEYVPGLSLRALVQEEGPRTGADLDRLAISSVTALTAIHRANVVHRDFKPQNVLMGPDGPRVIDFGIARAFDAGATMTSQVVGTPAYMAPEQFTGRVGPATDLFAWASTLLFAATGRDPFAGGALPAVMYRIMHETPDLSVLPAPLADVAAACLAKDPKARPTSEDVLLWLLGERERHARLDTATLDGARSPHPRPDPATEHLPTPTTPHQQPTARLPEEAPATRPWENPGNAAPGQNSLHLQPNAHPAGPTPSPGAPGGAIPGRDAWSPHAAPHPGHPTPSPGSPGGTVPGQDAWHDRADSRPGRPGASGGAPGGGVLGQDAWYDHGEARPGQPGPPGGAVPGQDAWYDRADARPGQPGPSGGAGQAGASAGVAGGAVLGADAWRTQVESGGGQPEAWPGQSGSWAGTGPAVRGVRRGPALVAGLLFAALLAAVDVFVLALLIAQPSLTHGNRGGLLPVAASSYVLVAIVTLVAVILAWRGSRGAVWTVMAARVVRVAMFAAWGKVLTVGAPVLAGYAVLTAVVVLLLTRGLMRSSR
ncbi:serine/threonine-protein kinase [Actinomadura chibensis]|uniref:serine/threonine-protein kinase n=1 Tax=Actinomadura chibensis TaxID=392828 RepID=UPI00082A69A3|nr:protein kinase [Actinomadura chibensis]